MALRREWTEWHLTPQGWQIGSTRHGNQGNNWQPEPEDRVLSAVYKEQQTASQSEPSCGTEESWRTKDPALGPKISRLLETYGPCPTRLR